MFVFRIISLSSPCFLCTHYGLSSHGSLYLWTVRYLNAKDLITLVFIDFFLHLNVTCQVLYEALWVYKALYALISILLYMQVLYTRGLLMELWNVPTLTTSFNRSFLDDTVPLFSSLTVAFITKMGCAKNVTIISQCECHKISSEI